MEQINIAEKLKNMPKGLEVDLYSPLLGHVTLVEVNGNVVHVSSKEGDVSYRFRHDGTYFPGKGECLIFPSEEKTWEHWQEKIMKKGCFVIDNKTNVPFFYDGNGIVVDCLGERVKCSKMDDYRFADTKEIISFLKSLMERGYKYNAKTHEIEERVQQRKDMDSGHIRISAIAESKETTFRITKRQYNILKVLLDYMSGNE